MEYTLNCNGRLVPLSTPQVMGILNVTPDSFYAESRKQSEREIAERTRQILSEGGTMIDVGGCSTRPGSDPVDEGEELRRVRTASPWCAAKPRCRGQRRHVPPGGGADGR